MIDALLLPFIRSALRLRYRVRLRGLREVVTRGRRGILFLPNHPALIDPVILLAWLGRPFGPHALADRDQVDRPVIRWLAPRFRVHPMPDPARYGSSVREDIERIVEGCAGILRAGGNLVLYPSGHAYRSRYEDLRGNSAVEAILRLAPTCRVVLVRTRGLWGSSFSYAAGGVPDVARALRRGARSLLASGLFFAPRRAVLIELWEPPDLLRDAGRTELNRFLERFYNEEAPPALYVPYTPFERGGPRALPEPRAPAPAEVRVPPAVREKVLARLRERTGEADIRDERLLERDLGLDSLAKAELAAWLQEESGFPPGDLDSLRTVADVLLAAAGQAISVRLAEVRPPEPAWRRPRPALRASLPRGRTITEAFLARARAEPGAVVFADPSSGARTYRDVIAALGVLKPRLERLEGSGLGILLPASAAAATCTLAALFSGKTPVMVNWTAGTRGLSASLDRAGARRVLASSALLERLERQGADLSPLAGRLLPVERLLGDVGRPERLAAALSARLSWAALERARPPETAVILFTSGSESEPKAVPLTHENILSDLRAALSVVELRTDDVLLGFLPPFHSFGLIVGVLAGPLAGFRTVYHPDPTEAAMLARVASLYGATLLVGTPTLLAGLARAAPAGDLRSVRLALTGAEALASHMREAIQASCPDALVMEGYGITECSPIVSLDPPEAARPGTIGRVLPTLEYALVDPEARRRAAPGGPGLLLLRGPSVFHGYLGRAPSPFVSFEGKRWYRTGDLVSEDRDGVLTFRGRLQRFVKLGGEMISLPAMESTLRELYETGDEEAPTLAVQPTAGEPPELVLFTTLRLERAEVNRRLRGAGLSSLHHLSRVVRLEALPRLGSGKVDYRALEAMLSPAPAG